MNREIVFALAAACVSAGCSSVDNGGRARSTSERVTSPTGASGGAPIRYAPPPGARKGATGPLRADLPKGDSALAASVSTGNGIGYGGGPIMAGTVNLYHIWYGNWSGSPIPAVLTDLANDIGGSALYGVNKTYSDNTGATVSGATNFAGSTSVGYTHGTVLHDADVGAIVTDVLSAGNLPVDGNGIYFVMTAGDVHDPDGMCTSFCGWHTYETFNGRQIKFAFIPDTAYCQGACNEIPSGTTPNGIDADSMASVTFHELSETASDPLIDAWRDPGTYTEDGDKCAYNFGTTYSTTSGAVANVHLGSRDYLLQQMWVNAGGGYCGVAAPATCAPTTCAAQGATCGSIGDGCGGTLTCGACAAPQTCGGGGAANVCGGGTTCTPTTCAAQGATCGSLGDRCGGTLTCGACTAPQTCGGGGAANVCGGGGGSTCATAYAQSSCLTYSEGTVVSSAGYNWTCSNGNCANCAGFASCAPGGSGCPWGTVWTSSGACN